ncbi:MAG: VOC family protein [Patescibacteria group bacterium]|nr:VOC family protein [Patescibacteria group bacterium]
MKFTSFSFASYAVTDVKRARAFYEGVLGLKATSEFEGDGYAFIEYNIGPDTLAIGMGAENFKPGKTGATVALELDGDFDAAMKELKAKEVKFLMDEPYDGPPCNMMLIEDPDGNQIMIHRRKAKN